MSSPRYKAQTNESDRQFLIVNKYDQPVLGRNDEPLVGEPLDRDSVTMRNFGKWTLGAEAGIGIMQLAHPQIGAAVDHTGKFWQNPYKRVGVSMDPIMAVVYAEDPRAAGDRVRQMHERISGNDHLGRKFNALNEDAFYWAHNTFQYGAENNAEHYNSDPFTDEDRERLQRESTTWYSYYGMPMGMVPADAQANREYRKDMIDNVLEMTPAAERALDFALNRDPPRPEGVPKIVWSLGKIGLAPVSEIFSLMTIGELPEDFRKRFDIPFSRKDQRNLDDIRVAARLLLGRLPNPIQYSPIAYDAILRESNGIHKSSIDKVLYTASSIGHFAVQKTLVPFMARAESLHNRLKAS